MKKNKGFTLVELIVVIAIIAVLSAVIAPQYMKYVEESRQANDLQVATNLMKAATVAVADPLNEIPLDCVIEVLWVASNNSRFDGWLLVREARTMGSTRTSAIVDSSYQVKNLDVINLTEGIIEIMGEEVLKSGTDYYGLLGVPESDIGKKCNFAFHIKPGTGEIALAAHSGDQAIVNQWIDEIGVEITRHPG